MVCFPGGMGVEGLKVNCPFGSIISLIGEPSMSGRV